MTNTGREYEQFVSNLHQAVLQAEGLGLQRNIRIERNKKLSDVHGLEREFDLYWEFEVGGITHRTVIECKDYSSRVSIDRIDAFIGKLRDFPDLRGVFATKTGYQSGALEKAKKNKIDLLIVREQNETDWTAVDGTPLIREIRIKFTVLVPNRIMEFHPALDRDWLLENTDIDPSEEDQLSFNASTDELIIENLAANTEYSLADLAPLLGKGSDYQPGQYDEVVELENAFLKTTDFRYKLRGYKVVYAVSAPVTEEIVIDATKELVGVIEYLEKGSRKSILKSGVVREDRIAPGSLQ